VVSKTSTLEEKGFLRGKGDSSPVVRFKNTTLGEKGLKGKGGYTPPFPFI
jgi:hypothetical protein